MAIFEYKCNQCGADFELLVNSSTVIACKSCGSGDLKKKLSLFGFSSNTENSMPSCADSCSGGFSQGTCGSGMCGCSGH